MSRSLRFMTGISSECAIVPNLGTGPRSSISAQRDTSASGKISSSLAGRTFESGYSMTQSDLYSLGLFDAKRDSVNCEAPTGLPLISVRERAMMTPSSPVAIILLNIASFCSRSSCISGTWGRGSLSSDSKLFICFLLSFRKSGDSLSFPGHVL